MTHRLRTRVADTTRHCSPAIGVGGHKRSFADAGERIGLRRRLGSVDPTLLDVLALLAGPPILLSQLVERGMAITRREGDDPGDFAIRRDRIAAWAYAAGSVIAIALVIIVLTHS